MIPFYAKHIKNQLPMILNKIKQKVYTKVGELEADYYLTKEPVGFADRLQGEYRPIKIGQSWGEIWDCAWMHIKGVVPDSARGKHVVLMLDINGEGCLFDSEGCPIRGITNVTSEFDTNLGAPGKRIVQYRNTAEGGEKVDLWLDAGCNDLFGLYKGNGTVQDLNIAVCNDKARDLYYDVLVLLEMLDVIDEKKARYHSILHTLEEMSFVLSDYNDAEFEEAGKIIKGELEKQGGTPSLTINAIGHAHIDLAWLWPIRETYRKGARTFSTAIEMLERYPDYIFGASQPQLYDWVKEKYPLLYDKVKNKVAEGRWETQGAMWVESDTNVPSGEALVRQFLYGKRFFREEFSKDMKILWLPDVFGYSAVLPQLMKKSGVDYFMTIKLNWVVTVERFPYNTFYWEGLDDSRVLVHMPPESTYNSSASVKAAAKIESDYMEKGVCRNALMLFGIGDGGGGPGTDHLERLKRQKNLEGICPIKQTHSLEFFQTIDRPANRYPKWKGELYVQNHQGTLTTQAKNKCFNRRMEVLLHNAEALCTLAQISKGYEYPGKKIENIYKEVLLYQFHDILPGSSIKRVHDESVERYMHLEKEINEIRSEALKAIVAGNKGLCGFNDTSFTRKEIIEYEGDTYWAQIKPYSFAAFEKTELAVQFRTGEDFIENNILKVSFNEDGTIKSVFNKNKNIEGISSGSRANVLKVYTDDGDAWDMQINYMSKPSEEFRLVSSETIVEKTYVCRRNTYKYGKSEIIQKVLLKYDSEYVEFQTTADWYEKNKMLRAEFPVTPRSESASCDIQFGNIKRPIINNTSWDFAKFEVCAHKWIDISENNYGVALLNDCKYGHSVKENVISINLLRGTDYPGENADMGEHAFTYALYPHDKHLNYSDVEQKAYELNYAVTISNGYASTKPLVDAEQSNIIVENIKLAEDSDEVVVRVYENKGTATKANISFSYAINSLKLCNLIEDDMEDVNFDGSSFEFDFKPFEIHSFKVKLLK